MNPYFNHWILAKLHTHYEALLNIPMRQLFEDEANRFDTFSLHAAGLFLDYSKNRITLDTLELLIELAKGADLEGYMDALFSGQNLNVTEHRAALHTALRDPAETPLLIHHIDIRPKIKNAFTMMHYIVTQLHEHKWKGYSKKPITDV